MKKFLLPAHPASAPGPRATEGEAGPARQGGLEEAERAKQEAPRLPGGLWKEIRAEGLSCDYTVLYGRAQADEAFQQLEKEVEYFEGEGSSWQQEITPALFLALGLEGGHRGRFSLLLTSLWDLISK